MAQIIKGQIIALFAFDLGFEVSLESLGPLLSSMPAPPLSRKKQTPTYLQYTNPPQIINLGNTTNITSPPMNIQATVYDFGALSIAYRMPLSFNLSELPQLSNLLYDGNLEDDASNQAQKLLNRIAPAIIRPELSELREDYYLFIIEELDKPLSGETLIEQYRAELTQVLRFETQPLSREQQDEALSRKISYYQNDLVIVDWNAAIIYDRDYWDVVNVLELLNVELLEARYTDAQLDKRISDYQGLVKQRAEWPLPFRTPYHKAIQELAELRIESLLLAERVENSLKLIGDLYLARIHAAATARFSLPEWETAISRKLEIIDDLYELLTDRVRNSQSQTLEIIIIVLILAEIVMALFK